MSHSVESLLGIGEVYSGQLARIGIKTTNDIIVFGPRAIWNRLDQSLSSALIDKWHAMTLLMQIKGIGPEEAFVLSESDRNAWHTLDDTSPERIQDIFENNDDGYAVPSTAEIARWQREAVKLQYTGMIAGRILDADKKPVVGARLIVGKVDTHSDESGSYVLSGIPFWEKELEVQAQGYYRFETQLTLNSDALQRLDIKLASSPQGWSHPARVSEWEGQMISAQKNDKYVKVNVPLEELPVGTPLAEYHRGKYKDGLVRLVSLFKIREGNRILFFRTKVDPQLIKGVFKDNALVMKKEDGLWAEGESVAEFQDRRIEENSWIKSGRLTPVQLKTKGGI